MQVQLVNIGNTLIKDLDVTVQNVTNLACKWGAKTDTDAAVLASANTVSAATEVTPLQKVVCEGTFMFDQAELDVDQNTRAFTPVVTTSSGHSLDSAPAGYTATATVSLAAVPALVLTVNATDCSIPSIIPPGDLSECCRLHSMVSALSLLQPVISTAPFTRQWPLPWCKPCMLDTSCQGLHVLLATQLLPQPAAAAAAQTSRWCALWRSTTQASSRW